MGETWASLDGDKDSSRAMSIKDSRCSKGSTKAIFPSGANSLRLSRNKSGSDRVSVCRARLRLVSGHFNESIKYDQVIFDILIRHIFGERGLIDLYPVGERRFRDVFPSL